MSMKSDQDLEKKLVELYSVFFLQLGYSQEQAREEVRKVIQDCKKEAKKDGWDSMPKDFGDWVIDNFKSGNPLAKKIVDKAKKEGVTDEEIRKYWNLNEWERRLMIWYDNIFRGATFYKAKDKGLSTPEAVIRLNKSFPLYGDSENAAKFSGDDRPLPYEIKDRVNAYIEKHGYSLDRDIINKYTSMNAFIRSEIKKGKL